MLNFTGAPMTQNNGVGNPSRDSETVASTSRTEALLLRNLIYILKPHVRGLRRWSVMRAMRESVQRQLGEVTPKFEHDVERVFRRYCAGDATLRACTAQTAPFFRPRDTAGEVWALHHDRAEALLRGLVPRIG
jgi:hypothetical protein